MLDQGQPPPPPPEGEKEGERAEDKKENTAYAKKMVLRLAGLMGLGGAVSIVYIFGECCQSKSEVFSVISFTNATTCRIPLPAPRFGLCANIWIITIIITDLPSFENTVEF